MDRLSARAILPTIAFVPSTVGFHPESSVFRRKQERLAPDMPLALTTKAVGIVVLRC
jgi:hypothetical protein